jgi:RimJ/RimL family protein N-acetyltransferase
LKRFIRAANESADRLLLGIHERDGDRHIGNIKLGPIDRPNRRGEIGILIGEESRWGRGYAREAIDALCRYGFANLGLHKLTAGCIADNLASLKAFAAVGFRDEARLRRHFHFEGRWVDGIRVARFADEA